MNVKLLWDIFLLFTRVALFSWGGGPASLALMQREVVTAGWATTEELRRLAVAQVGHVVHQDDHALRVVRPRRAQVHGPGGQLPGH